MCLCLSQLARLHLQLLQRSACQAVLYINLSRWIFLLMLLDFWITGRLIWQFLQNLNSGLTSYAMRLKTLFQWSLSMEDYQQDRFHAGKKCLLL